MGKKKMIRKLMLSLVLLSFFLISQGRTTAQNQKDQAPKLFIIGESKVVKGFPVVLKITAHGPQRVPKIRLSDEIGEIAVELSSTIGKDKYVISSTRQGMDIHFTTAEGEDIDIDVSKWFQTLLADNEERTMLFDLSALRPEIGKGTILDDIPPGKYSITIEFRSSGEKSNRIGIEILAPSEEERLFLQKILKLGASLRRGEGVNWSKFLKDRVQMPKDDLKTIGELAKRQLELHVLLSNILSSEEALMNVPMELLKSLPVPKHLEPEKECLFLEIGIKLEKTGVDEERTAFLAKYPGLTWRLKDTETESWSFLRRK